MSVARPKTPATLMATRNVYAPVLQELRGAMRGPETNLFCRTAELKAAVNERVPSEHALRTSGGAPNPATVAAEQAFVSAVEEVFGRCITTCSRHLKNTSHLQHFAFPREVHTHQA